MCISYIFYLFVSGPYSPLTDCATLAKIQPGRLVLTAGHHALASASTCSLHAFGHTLHQRARIPRVCLNRIALCAERLLSLFTAQPCKGVIVGARPHSRTSRRGPGYQRSHIMMYPLSQQYFRTQAPGMKMCLLFAAILGTWSINSSFGYQVAIGSFSRAGH